MVPRRIVAAESDRKGFSRPADDPDKLPEPEPPKATPPPLPPTTARRAVSAPGSAGTVSRMRRYRTRRFAGAIRRADPSKSPPGTPPRPRKAGLVVSIAIV